MACIIVYDIAAQSHLNHSQHDVFAVCAISRHFSRNSRQDINLFSPICGHKFFVVVFFCLVATRNFHLIEQNVKHQAVHVSI